MRGRHFPWLWSALDRTGISWRLQFGVRLALTVLLTWAGPEPAINPGCSYRSSSRVECLEVGDQGVVDLAGEVALDAAHDLRLGLPCLLRCSA